MSYLPHHEVYCRKCNFNPDFSRKLYFRIITRSARASEDAELLGSDICDNCFKPTYQLQDACITLYEEGWGKYHDGLLNFFLLLRGSIR